jgi:hypothetical protein
MNFKVGDKVLVKNYVDNGDWSKMIGTIVEVHDDSYSVKFSSIPYLFMNNELEPYKPLDFSKEKLIEIMKHCNFEVYQREGIFAINLKIDGKNPSTNSYYIPADDKVVTLVPSKNKDPYNLFTPHEVLILDVDDKLFAQIWEVTKKCLNKVNETKNHYIYNRDELLKQVNGYNKRLEQLEQNFKYKEYLNEF